MYKNDRQHYEILLPAPMGPPKCRQRQKEASISKCETKLVKILWIGEYWRKNMRNFLNNCQNTQLTFGNKAFIVRTITILKSRKCGDGKSSLFNSNRQRAAGRCKAVLEGKGRSSPSSRPKGESLSRLGRYGRRYPTRTGRRLLKAAPFPERPPRAAKRVVPQKRTSPLSLSQGKGRGAFFYLQKFFAAALCRRG